MPDFGIRDLSEHNSREDIAEAVMVEVRESIENYEPRVEFVDIIHVADDNPMRLLFTIECRVRDDSESMRVIFDTVFTLRRLGGNVSGGSDDILETTADL